MAFVLNAIFAVAFGAEAFVKLVGVGPTHYFKSGWNIFDFVITVLSLVGVVVDVVVSSSKFESSAIAAQLFSLMMIARVFRVLRVLRLVKSFKYAKGIRTLLTALLASAPALFNIGLLLWLVACVYAVVGMNIFKHVAKSGALTELVNFENFGKSVLLLFRLSTSAGWNDIVDALSISGAPDCNATHYYSENLGIPIEELNGDCGNSGVAKALLGSYVVVSFLVVVNMYIAVILDNLEYASKSEEHGHLTADAFDTYYDVWQTFDPEAMQFIRADSIKDFLGALPPPLGYPDASDIDVADLSIPLHLDAKNPQLPPVRIREMKCSAACPHFGS